MGVAVLGYSVRRCLQRRPAKRTSNFGVSNVHIERHPSHHQTASTNTALSVFDLRTLRCSLEKENLKVCRVRRMVLKQDHCFKRKPSRMIQKKNVLCQRPDGGIQVRKSPGERTACGSCPRILQTSRGGTCGAGCHSVAFYT